MRPEQRGHERDRGPVLVLIGSPGAGKTSVGRRVAERLGVPFADTDHLVEAAAGKPDGD